MARVVDRIARMHASTKGSGEQAKTSRPEVPSKNNMGATRPADKARPPLETVVPPVSATSGDIRGHPGTSGDGRCAQLLSGGYDRHSDQGRISPIGRLATAIACRDGLRRNFPSCRNELIASRYQRGGHSNSRRKWL